MRLTPQGPVAQSSEKWFDAFFAHWTRGQHAVTRAARIDDGLWNRPRGMGDSCTLQSGWRIIAKS